MTCMAPVPCWGLGHQTAAPAPYNAQGLAKSAAGGIKSAALPGGPKKGDLNAAGTQQANKANPSEIPVQQPEKIAYTSHLTADQRTRHATHYTPGCLRALFAAHQGDA